MCYSEFSFLRSNICRLWLTFVKYRSFEEQSFGLWLLTSCLCLRSPEFGHVVPSPCRTLRRCRVGSVLGNAAGSTVS